jgi:hypothetical protein
VAERDETIGAYSTYYPWLVQFDYLSPRRLIGQTDPNGWRVCDAKMAGRGLGKTRCGAEWVRAGGEMVMLTGDIMREMWPHGDTKIPGLVDGIAAAAPSVFHKYGLTSVVATAPLGQVSRRLLGS